MSEISQFMIVAGFGAICFGCGYLIAFIVLRNQWRDEMIKRGVARLRWQQIAPPFTVMLCGPSSMAKRLVNIATSALVAA